MQPTKSMIANAQVETPSPAPFEEWPPLNTCNGILRVGKGNNPDIEPCSYAVRVLGVKQKEVYIYVTTLSDQWRSDWNLPKENPQFCPPVLQDESFNVWISIKIAQAARLYTRTSSGMELSYEMTMWKINSRHRDEHGLLRPLYQFNMFGSGERTMQYIGNVQKA